MTSTSDFTNLLNSRGRSAFEAAEALTQLFGASSTMSSPSHCISDDESSSSPTTYRKSTKSNEPAKPEIFPLRLHAMLADDSVRSAISWLPRGRSFVVLKPDLFAETVLPVHFPEARGKAKYPSFTRKLNRWGFRQLNKGPDAGAFHHPLFRRDEPELSRGMACQKSVKSRAKAASKGTATAASQASEIKKVEETAAPQMLSQSPTIPPSLFSSSSHIKVKPSPLHRVAHRVPLKKRFSMSFASQSVSETPLLPAQTETAVAAARPPRRVSCFTETVTAPSVVNYSHHPQPVSPLKGDFQATLQQLQASMERAKSVAQQQPRAQVPIQPRPAVMTPTAAETHTSMLYQAYLQAMQQ